MMVMVESNEVSGPPFRAAGRELRSHYTPLPRPTYNAMLLPSPIVHVHYRHLFIVIHVNDLFTTPSALGFCRSSRSTYRIGPHSRSIPQYIHLVAGFGPWSK